MRQGRGAGQRQPRHHRKYRGKCYRSDEAEEQVTADRMRQINCRHAPAPLQIEDTFADIGHILRVVGDEHDRAETNDEGQDIEEADETGSVEH